MMNNKSPFFSPFCSPFGKAAVLSNSRIHPSPVLPKARSRWLLLAAANGIRLWTPWIWGTLDFRPIRFTS